MSKTINLIKAGKRYQQYEKYFHYLRLTVVIFGIAFIVMNIIFLGITYYKNHELNSLISRVKENNAYLQQNQETEAQFVYFGNKLLEVSRILKDDVNFEPYYNLLTQSLKTSSQEARFESVEIDKNKQVEFSVALADYKALLSFFKFAESDSFLKYFNDITLTNFDLTEQKKSYKLTFKGKFKDINDNQN